MISIMFHSAGLNSLKWRSAHISDPLDIVREKLEVIRDEGYTTISMREAVENIGKKRDGLVHLCFDDGYLDNWVHIFPILKELGQKATIFMTTEFVDPRDVVRKRKNLTERSHDPAGCCAGFLSFREMKEMEASGLVEIQSHALTHTWYFKGPRIVDFWHPGSATGAMGPIWMIWNRFPEKKPFYLTEAAILEKEIPYGTPVYEHGKSLETRRFFPDEYALEERLTAHVASRPAGFFDHPGWKAELAAIVGEYRRDTGGTGRYETKEAHDDRIWHELTESKRLLEDGLGHEVPGLCLPGGGATDETIKAARKAGYIYFTLPSRLRDSADSDLIEGMIPRIGNLPRVLLKGKDLGYPSRSDFRNHLRMNNGYSPAKLFFALGKLKRLISTG
jgi:peptidoglycan/xylan/chitin deacetylase (PgdA/CDA1 family)